MEQIIYTLNDLIWSNALIVLCLGAGIYFSVRTGFVQIRYFREMIHLLFSGKSSKKGVSSFQAFALALSGRIGTGNIAGVATAIGLGGPGAIFWMWIIAFLGSASAYIEATLGQIFKEVKGGEYRGGPAYYIEKGLGIKWYAMLFAFVTIISMSFLLPGVQSNSIALSVNNAFDVPVEYTGGVVCLFLAMVIFGGIKRIGKVAEILVPFMAMGYVLLAIIIIGINITEVPTVLKLIVSSAFNQEAAYSAVFGSAIAWGVKRGIYSNEAGQGTAPHAASAAEVSHPAKQGLVQAFSVYIDTLFVCTATACMILFTGQFNVLHPDGGFLVENLPGIAIGPEFTQNAIAVHFPTIGAGFVAVALMFFSFTTIMAYYYIAETNLSYLQKNDTQKWPIHVLRILIIIATFYGAIRTAQVAWTFGDIGVGLMAWLNIIAILLLRKPALEALKDYKKKKDAGEDPDYDFEGMKKHYSKN
ncbi:MAG TPA: sodium:alanine symporter [Algoriphagus sp.]|jgi:AGCS family alanine or glycine:cation symporter|uniref:alanine/glycine:cation symporter family protein n=1 Tax=unclassified Algoriphagus TaxID=2641541 RepID=UPI000C3D1644|nr:MULTISPECIES: alanine/glycine:cation symporter family protein [unclassified Algoriphagus]MAL15176.1 sodium:alanine symporter [Algoriphagus sp.]QYH37805.1 alanine:cation symporter family protein [Algoriphagus sp. NBT04N3]HAS57221.1 sodium:alanine symporter [Algoriphagus sp.]HCD88807.1 sodium:alanine symporter [Algoriphagus sp.]HCH44632.1 sodium:alanine symporter [Algoriphagus sp.]|tara:strand:- start:12576 stop:13991 length:1416 start_codon:yes stop_codon:yes gene_type:complete